MHEVIGFQMNHFDCSIEMHELVKFSIIDFLGFERRLESFFKKDFSKATLKKLNTHFFSGDEIDLSSVSGLTSLIECRLFNFDLSV